MASSGDPVLQVVLAIGSALAVHTAMTASHVQYRWRPAPLMARILQLVPIALPLPFCETLRQF